MMTVLFKNGERIKIGPETMDKLYQKITSSDGAKKWQFFTDLSVSATPHLLINLDEVVCIFNEYIR